MRTLAVMNQKGGSGKTTTAVNVAAAWCELGRRVLLVDLDPQANASTWLGVTDAERELLDVFTENRNLSDVARDTDVAGLSLVPSSTWLIGVDKALAGEVGAETIFRRALERLPHRWDLVIVDCPPSLGLLALSALVGCGELLVPVETRVMALSGLVGLFRTVERVRERLNPDLALAGILPCRVDMRTRLSQEVMGSLRQRFPTGAMETFIRENVRLAEAYSYAQPIGLYDPKSAGAEDYRAAALELLGSKRGEA